MGKFGICADIRNWYFDWTPYVSGADRNHDFWLNEQEEYQLSLGFYHSQNWTLLTGMYSFRLDQICFMKIREHYENIKARYSFYSLCCL